MMEQPLNMTDTEYKAYHESRMENNHGSDALHTFLCIFFTVQCTLFSAISFPRAHYFRLIYEYLLIILPLILAHTVLCDYVYVLNILICLIILVKLIKIYPKLEIYKSLMALNYFKNSRIISISSIRGLTYLITVFCILAVDFEAFPRHLAKTEHYGYSLMDTGVGLFVLMSGLVHKDMHHMGIVVVLKKNVKFISILLLLGISRFVSVKQLDYHEHVSEYGVHWNFFFTLAVCKLFSSLLLSYSQNSLVASIVIMLLHEYLLYIGLEGWVFGDSPRTNFLNANREGIASSLGYVSLYLFAVHIKTLLCNVTVQRYKIQMELMFLSICLWLTSIIINIYRPTSRTLANAGYCVYLEATLVTVVLVLYLFETQFQEKNLTFHVPLVITVINDNGLLYFLIANLMTGAINLSIRTFFVSISKSFIIFNIYMVMSLLLIKYLQEKGLNI